MSDSKRQSLVLIGLGLIVVAAVLLYFAFSQPKTAVTADYSQTQDTASQAVSSLENELMASSSEQASADIQNTDTAAYSEYTENESSSLSVAYPLNLNTCTAQELMTIDDIGEKRAGAIIQYREKLGGYTSVEQIKDISGIGDELYSRISQYLTV